LIIARLTSSLPEALVSQSSGTLGGSPSPAKHWSSTPRVYHWQMVLVSNRFLVGRKSQGLSNKNLVTIISQNNPSQQILNPFV